MIIKPTVSKELYLLPNKPHNSTIIVTTGDNNILMFSTGGDMLWKK